MLCVKGNKLNCRCHSFTSQQCNTFRVHLKSFSWRIMKGRYFLEKFFLVIIFCVLFFTEFCLICLFDCFSWVTKSRFVWSFRCSFFLLSFFDVFVLFVCHLFVSAFTTISELVGSFFVCSLILLFDFLFLFLFSPNSKRFSVCALCTGWNYILTGEKLFRFKNQRNKNQTVLLLFVYYCRII